MVESASSRKDGKVVAIVAAAGAGHRLGADRPKAFVRVGDYTLLQHTLRRIDASTAVDEIIIIASFEMCATACPRTSPRAVPVHPHASIPRGRTPLRLHL